MLAVIRKHIAKEWLVFFLSAFILLILLLTVANLVSGFLRPNVSAIDVLINHLIELPGYSSQIFPVACLMASLFSINKMKNRNELTAIFASGFSRQDFIITIVVVASLASVFQFTFSSYLYPFTMKNRHVWIADGHKKFGNLKSKGLMTSTISSGKLWYRTKDFFLAFSAFDKKTSVLQNVTLYYITPPNRLAERISAKSASYIGKGNWRFIDGKSHSEIDKETFPQSENFAQKDIDLSMELEQFVQAEADITTLDIHQLREYIGHLDDSGINTSEYQVMYWDKFSSTFICVLFALLAAIGIFNPNRRSSSFGKTVVVVFVFTLVYWFVYSYVSELGRSGKVSAFLSCFSVPSLFLCYLMFVFYRNRHLSN